MDLMQWLCERAAEEAFHGLTVAVWVCLILRWKQGKTPSVSELLAVASTGVHSTT